MTSHLTRFAFALIGAFLVSILSFTSPSPSQAAVDSVAVTGFDHINDTTSPVTVYHWTLQEDVTFQVVPGVTPAPDVDDTSDLIPFPGSPGDVDINGNGIPEANILSTGFHKRHIPVVMSGTAGGAEPVGGCAPLPAGSSCTDPAVAISYFQGVNPDTHYYISVLPATGYNMGGSQIPPTLPLQVPPVIDIQVNIFPIPTAQISIFVFEDDAPINHFPDIGEAGLEGFEVLLEEDVKYGLGGQVLVDAFGNPLGTTYSDGDGTILVIGSGRIFTDADGGLLIKNLTPGKYGVKVVPPLLGPFSGMFQTSTLEGSKTIDTFVVAGGGPTLLEFERPQTHAFFGFSKFFNNLASLGPPGVNGVDSVTVTGSIGNIHLKRPPGDDFHEIDAFPHSNCIVTLNVAGVAIYAAACDVDPGDGSNLNTFTIPGVPPGNYTLYTFDKFLVSIFGVHSLKVGDDGSGGLTCVSQPNQSCNLQRVAEFQWFGRSDNFLFLDTNKNGFPDPGEVNLQAEFATVLRHGDGTVNQSIPTDSEGAAPYDVVFPFFNWFVAEVDFGSPLNATGATFVVDAGGPVPPDNGWTLPSFDLLNPQQQFCSEQDVTDLVPGCAAVDDPLININTGNNLSRTELGVVLTEGYQIFASTTNVTYWGKVPYEGDENGGIAGIVFYGVTRAENDPAFGAGEEWEPGIPRVQVNLYEDIVDTSVFPFVVTGVIKDLPDEDNLPLGNFPGPEDVDRNSNGVLDLTNGPDVDNIPFLNFPGPEDIDLNGNGIFESPSPNELADIDNIPQGNFPGPEDVDRNQNGLLDLGDALEIAYTDSWDDSLPTGCTKDVLPADVVVGVNEPFKVNGITLDCYDGLRAFNQMRPEFFDGGYAFAGLLNDFDDPADPTAFPGGMNDIDHNGDGILNDNGALPPGFYIVETVTPPGYAVMKEEDKNVDLGLEFESETAALPQKCVGDDHVIPAILSLQADAAGNQIVPAGDEIAAPLAGETVKLCDRKSMEVRAGQNAAGDFWLLTKAPIAAHGKGQTLNDLANERLLESPNFGEKFGPAFLPIGFHDWTGKEIGRVYGDEFGTFNALLPSTFSANVPNPSGFSPAMYFACMNDKGPIPVLDVNNNPVLDPVSGEPLFEIDPAHNPSFTQSCYVLQYMPGSTTYLDTPVIPNAAFVGDGLFPPDCECEDGIPAIASVNGDNIAGFPGGSGPWIPKSPVLPDTPTIVIQSMGLTEVPNPGYEGPNTGSPISVTRDYGFGATPGTVTLTRPNGAETLLIIDSWDTDAINATVPPSATGSNLDYQLLVTRGDNGNTTKVGITFTVRRARGGFPGRDVVHHVFEDPSDGQATQIQDMIDDPSVMENDLIIIHPGAYFENVILHKAVRLQCSGTGSTFINVPSTLIGSKREEWFDRVEALHTAGEYDLLPVQDAILAGGGTFEDVFSSEAGVGIMVVMNTFNNVGTSRIRIDGCHIAGAGLGGGIVVNAYARNMVISNNRISNNFGTISGGIRYGNPLLIEDVPGTASLRRYVDSRNIKAHIHHNMITQNANSGIGAGGGIGLFSGTHRYRVDANFIACNFTQGHGAGMAHWGLNAGIKGNSTRFASNRITNNTIKFNEAFNQGLTRHGGGLFIGGQPTLNANLLSKGSGSVLIDGNLIQGNFAGAGEGGGIRLDTVNGNRQGPINGVYNIDIFNNFIVNNVSSLRGAGISMFDATEVEIVHNTIANNDNTGTHGSLFQLNESTPEPAGIVSNALSPGLDAAQGHPSQVSFSNPLLVDNIIWHNRSFRSELDDINFDPPRSFLVPDVVVNPLDVVYDDLAVVGTPGLLSPVNCVLSTLDEVDPFGVVTVPGAYAGSGNITDDPDFVSPYVNGARSSVLTAVGVASNMELTVAFDEGGNFDDIEFGPLTCNATPDRPASDYHIDPLSPARDAGVALGTPGLGLEIDFDDEPRPDVSLPDIGADEIQ